MSANVKSYSRSINGYQKLVGVCLSIAFICAFNLAMAQSSQSTMTEEAKSGQKIQNPLYPQIQLPLTYNYNQKLGANNNVRQAEIGFNPIIPVDLGSDLQWIFNPMLTYNRNVSGQQVTNQNQPLQLPTFFSPRLVGEWYFGIGPYIQTPASNANNGTLQTGVGVSVGAFYAPENWVLGVAMFNSWGIGNNLAGGTANIINAQPTISYTTDHAWTYNLSSQIIYNYDAKAATNQLTLSGGKTFKIMGYHIQWQVGPTYMVTSNPLSPKGVGAYASLTTLLPK